MRYLSVSIAILLPILVLAQTWNQHIVDNDFDGVVSVHAADVDGDGDADVLGAGYNADTIVWWENVNGGQNWIQHTVADTLDAAFTVFATDMDGDGDVDVVGAAYIDDAINWWENLDGSGEQWTEHSVDSAIDGIWSVYATDIDGDGNQDVLGAASHANKIAWWEDLGGDQGG